MQKVIKKILDLVYVPRCAVCNSRMNESGKGICKSCFEKYEDAKAKYCDFCGMEARICVCQPQKLLISGCTDYRKLVFYKTSGEHNVIRGIVYSLKRRGNKPLAKFIAAELAAIDGEMLGKDTIVSYCPRSVKNRKKYGYDHAKTLAKYYADSLSLEMKTLLRRNPFHRSSEQKLLNYNQRAANMRGAYILKEAADISGKTVVLIDDVVTSGSTMGECVAMLYSAGAENVICRSLGHTYKKNKSKKD